MIPIASEKAMLPMATPRETVALRSMAFPIGQRLGLQSLAQSNLPEWSNHRVNQKLGQDFTTCST